MLYCCLYYIISGEEGYDMKKIAALFLSLMIISPTVFADDDITVYLNEDELIFEQSPIIQNDSTLVPFRAIFENLDMVVQWFGDEQRVTAQKRFNHNFVYRRKYDVCQ